MSGFSPLPDSVERRWRVRPENLVEIVMERRGAIYYVEICDYVVAQKRYVRRVGTLRGFGVDAGKAWRCVRGYYEAEQAKSLRKLEAARAKEG